MLTRTSRIVLIVSLIVGTLGDPAAASKPEEHVYLSLGTSLAAGSLADEAGNTTASSDYSYTDQLYQRIKGRMGARLVHEKLGCPGETVVSIRNSSLCRYEEGRSQLEQAIEVIKQGNVVLITIDLGANDIIHARTSCGGNPACIVSRIPVIAGEVGAIVGELRSLYSGPILAMNYYNPQVAMAIGYYPGVAGQGAPRVDLAIGSDLLLQGFNGALGTAYELVGVEVVDVYAVFRSGTFDDQRPRNGMPDNVDTVCALSYMCPGDSTVKANIHLTRHGYRVVARAFLQELHHAGLAG